MCGPNQKCCLILLSLLFEGGCLIRLKQLRDTIKDETSGHAHTPASARIVTDLTASGISQQLTQGHLSSETTPDARPDPYSEGACDTGSRGKQAFLQACLSAGSHAEAGVSANHDGNFRRLKGHLEWHHFARIFVPQKPNTSTAVTG